VFADDFILSEFSFSFFYGLKVWGFQDVEQVNGYVPNARRVVAGVSQGGGLRG
jgi:hypothetical protein